MLNLVPLLLGPQNADPLTLLRTTLASPKTVTANVSSGGVRGTLTVAGDGSLLLVAGSERILHGADGDWEIDSANALYDRLPPAGPLLGGRIGTERLTDAAHELLVPILVRRGRGLLDRRFARKDGAYVATLGGGPMGAATLTVAFGRDRSLARVVFRGPDGGAEWRISGFRVVPNDPARFRTTVPTGFSEAFEPDVPATLRIGSPLPAPYAKLAPSGAKAWILAVLERGDAASDGARTMLGRLTPDLPSAVLEDPSVQDRRALITPDSPTYLLIGRGKILGVWLGWSPGEEARLERELREAAEEAGNSAYGE